MCIALLSTAHPSYTLVLISNRDEFLSRPTAPADWWAPPNENVLGGRDLLRKERGTWLGITKQGRLAVLTNFREEGQIVVEAKSRGGIVNSFLTATGSTKDFVDGLFEHGAMENVGGFSLICGVVGEPLAMVSNRFSHPDDVQWIGGKNDETIGLSNAAVGDRSWPKVTAGEGKLKKAIQSSQSRKENHDLFITDLLRLLSTDTLPRCDSGQTLESCGKELKKSIFIPVLGGDAVEGENADQLAAAEIGEADEVLEQPGPSAILGLSGRYGTQKQTVILVDHDQRVHFVEKTLSHLPGVSVDTSNLRKFEFKIDEPPSQEEL